MIFSCNFGKNNFRLQIALALRARAILLVFEKFTRADLTKLHSKSCDYLY